MKTFTIRITIAIVIAVLGTLGIYNLVAKGYIPFKGGHVKIDRTRPKAEPSVKAPSPLAEGRPAPPRSTRYDHPSLDRSDADVKTETFDTRVKPEQKSKFRKEKEISPPSMVNARKSKRTASSRRYSAQTYGGWQSPDTQEYKHPAVCGAPPAK
jgi:hypothetical protein